MNPSTGDEVHLLPREASSETREAQFSCLWPQVINLRDQIKQSDEIEETNHHKLFQALQSRKKKPPAG